MSFSPDQLLMHWPLPAAAGGVVLAYSGGLDSSVLLESLALLHARGAIPRLLAVHVHHGLQAAADDWAAHCAAQCTRLNVQLQVAQVRIAPDDPAGPEGAARRERYAALTARMRPGDVLATAHHLDDQAETFLMRAVRGAGPRGLGAMRGLQGFGPGWLWRPLLDVQRVSLRDWAVARGLAWIEDPHNQDPRYERSWLRQQLMPVLGQRWPAAVPGLARSAQWSAEADDLLADLAALDAATVQSGAQLQVPALLALSPQRRRNLVRWWLREQHALPPAPQPVLQQLDGLLTAAADATPQIAWPGAQLRRYRGLLYAMPALAPLPPDFQVPWTGEGRCELPAGCGALRAALPEARALLVRLPRGGERFVPAGSRHRRTLKNLFQEHAVPPWVRQRTPLLYEQGELRWVGGLGEAAGLDARAQPFYRGLRWEAESA